MNHDELFWAILKALIAFEIIKAALNIGTIAALAALEAVFIKEKK